jgi:hypothetical protein
MTIPKVRKRILTVADEIQSAVVQNGQFEDLFCLWARRLRYLERQMYRRSARRPRKRAKQ